MNINDYYLKNGSETLKKLILKRGNYRCNDCGKKCEDLLIMFYPENNIILCKSCYAKIHQPKCGHNKPSIQVRIMCDDGSSILYWDCSVCVANMKPTCDKGRHILIPPTKHHKGDYGMWIDDPLPDGQHLKCMWCGHDFVLNGTLTEGIK